MRGWPLSAGAEVPPPAAAALAERADTTKMTGAEILRHSVGLEGNHLAGGEPGALGEDWLIRKGCTPERLPGKVTVEVSPGDRLVVRTPGGGGLGS